MAVNNTNLTKRIRWLYIALARKRKAARVWVVFFDDFERVYAQNTRRADGEGRVPERILNEQLERLELPTKKDGFDSVLSAG